MKNSLFRKSVANVLAVLMIMGGIGAGFTALDVADTRDAYAATADIHTISAGQTVNMGPTTAPTGFRGESNWQVLNVIDDNSDGVNDRALLVSKELWIADDDDYPTLVKYNSDVNKGNTWVGSDAESWCNSIYIEVMNKNPAIANTDGKYVFFLSEADVNNFFPNKTDRIKKSADAWGDEVATGWWLSTTYSDAIVKYVNDKGEIKMGQVNMDLGTRPAFYLDLNKVECVSYFKQWIIRSHTAGKATRENEVAATCSAEGSYDEVKKCKDCGAEISRETKTIDKLAHTPGEAVHENEVAATCKAAGSYDEVVKCKDCGAEISRETKTIDKLAHTPGEAARENEVAATCAAEGSYDEVVKCTECNELISSEHKIIDKSDVHTPGEAVHENEVSATEQAKGSYDEVVYCTVCKKELSRETKEIPQLDPSTRPDDTKPSDQGQSGQNAVAKPVSASVNSKTVSAAAIQQAVKKAGANGAAVDTIVLGKKVKKISKNAFKGTDVKTIVVTSKKLKKKSVKGSLKGSKVTTVKVKVGKAKVNKKYAKKYKKYFTKKNAGKKVKVRKF